MPVWWSVSSIYFIPCVWANVFILENSMRAGNLAFLYHKSSGINSTYLRVWGLVCPIAGQKVYSFTLKIVPKSHIGLYRME